MPTTITFYVLRFRVLRLLLVWRIWAQHIPVGSHAYLADRQSAQVQDGPNYREIVLRVALGLQDFENGGLVSFDHVHGFATGKGSLGDGGGLAAYFGREFPPSVLYLVVCAITLHPRRLQSTFFVLPSQERSNQCNIARNVPPPTANHPGGWPSSPARAVGWASVPPFARRWPGQATTYSSPTGAPTTTKWPGEPRKTRPTTSRPNSR